MAKSELKTIGELFKDSSQAVRRNLTVFIFLNTATILGLAWDIGSDIRDKTHSGGWGQVFVNSLNGGADYNGSVAWLGVLLAVATIVLGLLLGFLEYLAAKKKIVSFDEVWSLFKKRWWQVIITWILLIICVIPGLILLVIPGLYLISRLAFAPIVTIDEGLTGFDAIRRSWDMTKNHAWTVFATVFFAFVLSLPSIIPIVGRIAATVLVIAYSVALPIRYFELKGRSR